MRKKLLSILLAALMIVSILPTVAFAEGEGTLTELKTLLTSAESGATIKLDKDYKYSSSTDSGYNNTDMTAQNRTLTLDLNGHTIDFDTLNKGFLMIRSGNDITICDTSVKQTGTIKNASYCAFVLEGARLTLAGGTISGCKGGSSGVSGTITVNGNFIMTGGKIINNTQSTGAIQTENGTVILCGGEVSGNAATAASIWSGGIAFGQESSSAHVYLGGDFRLVNNKNSNGNPSNLSSSGMGTNVVELSDGTTTALGMTVPAPKDGMSIGLYTSSVAYDFKGMVTASSADALQYFFSDTDNNIVSYQNDKVGLVQGTSYAIGTMPTCTNGSITTNKSKYAAGETVKVFATPAGGYRLAKLTVTIGNGEPVDITDTKSFEWPTDGKAVILAAEFAEKNSGSAEIEVTVPELNPEYTIHIPAKTTLEYGKTEMQELNGEVYITDPKDLGNKKVTCTVSGTNLKNGEKELTTTYFYGADGATAVSTTPTFDCGTGASNGTAIYAKVADWSGAVAGKYTATVSFQFALADQPQ